VTGQPFTFLVRCRTSILTQRQSDVQSRLESPNPFPGRKASTRLVRSQRLLLPAVYGAGAPGSVIYIFFKNSISFLG
jgi:hypothetical protein